MGNTAQIELNYVVILAIVLDWHIVFDEQNLVEIWITSSFFHHGQEVSLVHQLFVSLAVTSNHSILSVDPHAFLLLLHILY